MDAIYTFILIGCFVIVTLTGVWWLSKIIAAIWPE